MTVRGARTQSGIREDSDPHSKLDRLECDELNINLSKSSQFVVGKQTNFNGPVTILNVPNSENTSEHSGTGTGTGNKYYVHSAGKTQIKPQEDNVVIRGALLSSGASSAVLRPGDRHLERQQDLESCKQRPDTTSGSIIRLLFSHSFLKIPIAGWITIVGVAVAIVATMTISLMKTKVEVEGDQLETGDQRIELPGRHFLYSKEDWGGLPPSSYVTINLPVPFVVISHTATGFCYEPTTCTNYCRDIQRYHMSKAFADIAYNFMVGGDGNIYEGRGWDHRSPLEGFVNNLNIDINFIGDFSLNDIPTQPQVDGVLAIINYGIQLGTIDANYSLIAMNETGTATLSPGKNVYAVIKEWSHFVANPLETLTLKMTKTVEQKMHGSDDGHK